MTSLEKVAEAICNSMEADVFGEMDANSIYRAAYIQQAKAALNALKNPDEGTVEAMLDASDEAPDNHTTRDGVTAIFNMAIDHVIGAGSE